MRRCRIRIVALAVCGVFLGESVIGLEQTASPETRSGDLEVLGRAVAGADPHRFLKALSDEIGPRLTGSQADQLAGQWALREMRSIGLHAVHAESWQLNDGWIRGHARVRLTAPFEMELAAVSYGWSGSTKGVIDAEVLTVVRDTSVDPSTIDASRWNGKVLLLEASDTRRADPVRALSQLPALLAAAAAAGAVAVINPDPRPGTILPHTGPVGFPMHSTPMVVLDMAAEHVRLLSRTQQAGGHARLRLDVANRFTGRAVSSQNIVGEIAGSEHPEEVVLLGAHLDSWDLSAGINDDGFGVAAVLGAAQALVASRIAPKRTIRFVLFTGEEQGLLGSRAYVDRHRAEMKDVLCAFVLDWGGGPVTKLVLAGHDELAAPLEELFHANAPLASLQVAAGYLTYTDAFSFTLAGVPGIAAFQDSPAYASISHSAADTLDRVDPRSLDQGCLVMASVAVWVANSPARIGALFSPARTAQSLTEQRTALQLLGLWPF